MEMTSNKPYLIRALHEWISDNECTPYLYINTSTEGLHLPAHLQAENPLILNASINACKDVNFLTDAVTFQAMFSGQVFEVYLPIDSVIAIVARETGQGMTFEREETDQDSEKTASDEKQTTNESDSASDEKDGKHHNKSGLKIIR